MATDQDRTPTEPLTLAGVRGVVDYALDSRSRLTKNGETWKTYVFRVVTVDRVVMGIVLIYTLGGNVRDVQRTLAATTQQAVEAAQKAEIASQRADAASRKADTSAQALQEARTELAGVVADLQRNTAQNADLRDRVSQSVTRSEFSSAIAQQLLPRLERIEQRLWEQR